MYLSRRSLLPVPSISFHDLTRGKREIPSPGEIDGTGFTAVTFRTIDENSANESTIP